MEILHTIIDKIIYIVYYIIAFVIYYFKNMTLYLRIGFSLQIIFGLVTYFFGYFYRKNFVRKFKKQYPDENVLFLRSPGLISVTILNTFDSIVYIDYIKKLFNGNLLLKLWDYFYLGFHIFIHLFLIIVGAYIVLVTNKRVIKHYHKIFTIKYKYLNADILINKIKKIEANNDKKIVYVHTEENKFDLPQISKKYFKQLHQLLLMLLEKEKLNDNKKS